MPDDIQSALSRAFTDDTYRCVLGGPVAGERFRRISLRRLESGVWQAESFTDTQAFHENMEHAAALGLVAEALGARFRSLNSWDSVREHSIRVSKKGKALYQSTAASAAPKAEAEHNRGKRYLLPQGAIIPPLVDMGIFTVEGKVAAPMQHKYRQINRFVELIDDAVRDFKGDALRIIDFGCGKSYLTFVLYHYLTEIRGLKAEMVGLDLKEAVIEKCNLAVQKYGYDGLRFEVGDIAGYIPPWKPDMVISLHACDTATDHALYNAVRWGAQMIFAAPCCQHELNAQMQRGPLPILSRYGIVQERTAALMTDAIRANALTACGYRAQLLEFIDIGHTPKNILIRAVRQSVSEAARQQAEAENAALCAAFGFAPTLLELLRGASLPSAT